MAHKHDVELQIRLAELQADIQINLTAAFGFLAAFLALTIGIMQIILMLPSGESFMPIKIFFAALATAAALCGIGIIHFLHKVNEFRKEFEELKKEYCW